MKLKIENSCEIDDLIDFMVVRMGKTHREIEKMINEEYLYPEYGYTFVTTQFGKNPNREKEGTIRNSLFDYMIEEKIVNMYITEGI